MAISAKTCYRRVFASHRLDSTSVWNCARDLLHAVLGWPRNSDKRLVHSFLQPIGRLARGELENDADPAKLKNYSNMFVYAGSFGNTCCKSSIMGDLRRSAASRKYAIKLAAVVDHVLVSRAPYQRTRNRFARQRRSNRCRRHLSSQSPVFDVQS